MRTLKVLLGVSLLALSLFGTAACSDGLVTAPSGASVTTETSPVTKVAGGNTATGVEEMGVPINITLMCASPADPPAPIVYLSSGDAYVLTFIWDEGQISKDATDGQTSINLPKGKTVRVVPSVRVSRGDNEYTSPAPFDFVVADGSRLDLLFRRPCGGGQVTPVSCVTPKPTILVGETARFSAKDGDVNQPYSWNSGDGAPPSGTSTTFETSFATIGDKTVTVTNAGTTASCAVKVLVKEIPPSCSGTTSTLTKGADGLSETTIATSVTASFAGSGATGVLTVGGVETPFTSGTPVPLSFTRPEAGQPDKTIAVTLTTTVSGSQCELKTVTITVPAKPATCAIVNGSLDPTVRITDATHASVTFNSRVTGPTGASGTLMVDGKSTPPNSTIVYERFGPGVPNNVQATYATALNGQSCAAISKVVAIPPQDDHGNACYQITTATKLGSGLIEVRSKTVGLEACTGSGVLGRVQLNAPYTSHAVTAVKAGGGYDDADHSDGDRNIVFGMREIPPGFEAIYHVAFTAPGATSASVCTSDQHSDWKLWTCASSPIPLP